MKTQTKIKALMLALCVGLIALASVFGTLAYLTDTETVENTFTVGNVTITMDEAAVNTDGAPIADAERVKANEYHLIPGHSYTKDPTIHVAEGSEDCYLFVKIENQIAEIEDETATVASQMATNGWTLVTGETDIYAYKNTAKAGDNVVVFNNFTVAGKTDNAGLEKHKDSKIIVTGYAVQAYGFDNANDAWTASGLQ